ncbi:MAG TPA: hypothetical protein VNW95_07260 [Mucilaginibacter sp.]|jgi:hypothetical protein|nr:hypothetical protein [Mucilaginibacter sp.]
MDGISPWVAAVKEIFNEQDLPVIFKKECGNYTVKQHCIYNALWITVTCPKGSQVVLRAAYSPNDHLQVTRVEHRIDGFDVWLNASMGNFKVSLTFPENDKPLFRYTTTLVPAEALLMPFWPRDMVVTGRDGHYESAAGTVHVSQAGTRSGLVYLSMDKPRSGSLLYMQNLTALNDYFQATETSASGVVGGKWPELGLALPPTKEKPLFAHKEVVLSDAFLAFDPENPKDEFESAKLFMNLLTDIYLHLPRPDTQYHDWLKIVDSGLKDLENSHGCWSHANGHDYLNAYVCDYETPPEIMVQLAVLLPMLEYRKWSKSDMHCVDTIRSGLSAFYDEKVKTVVRWLPAQAEHLDGSEEQLKPNVMDSWYLNHPLLNLSRMAINGDKDAEKLFLDSLPFTMKVARHFNYDWPVFYDIETLEVIKGETQPGKGGEKDVAGLYALVMLQAWDLTKEQKYLDEAKKAAKTLQGKGFTVFYQANNTAFSAKAMLRLYKETKQNIYLDLGYLCLAGIMKNYHLWECHYGYAKDYSTFFGIFPLNDAPYTAAYEEQEVFASAHEFLELAEGLDILPSISLLLAEFVRYIVQRAAYYYPPNLPREMLSEKVKMGEVDPNLWIAIEDIHDGWEKSGEVGQEVYGAGVAFGIVPRHYHQVAGEHFMIYIDYPTGNFAKKGNSISFNVKGDNRLTCRLMVIRQGTHKLPEFSVTGKRGDKKENIPSKQRKDGHLEFTVSGGQDIHIKW